MELLEGATLSDHLARHGPMSSDELRDVFHQLCHGLAAAHARGLIHRDLKPDNVFLQLPRSALGGRFVKVLDFGVAKALGPSRTRGTASIIVGTQGWWAPEQMLGGMISPATDVWALGLLAYWCLTGKMFHETAQQMEVTATARAREQGVAGRVPPSLDPWFAQCLAWEPTQRFRDASAAWRALDATLPRHATTVATAPTALTAAPATTATSTTPPPVQLPTARVPASRSSGVAVVVGLVVFGVGAAVAWSWSTPSSPSTPTPMPSDVWSFLQQWNAQLDAIARYEPANVGSFYAEQTRLRGSRNTLRTRIGVGAYWEAFFRQQGGTIRFDWTRATAAIEALDGSRDSHRACALVAGAEPQVLFVRVPAVEDNPQSGVETRDRVRCTHVEGLYLLRLMSVGGTWQICHDTWSMQEAICPSCPTTFGCEAPGAL
jgi:hypothetical protein